MDRFMQEAIDEARSGLAEGGIPIGSVIVRDGKVIGRGRNRHVQNGDPTAHAEMECLRDMGPAGPLSDATLYTTMAPCIMCAGAMVHLGVGKVVIGDTTTFEGAMDFMREHGVEVETTELDELHDLAGTFIRDNPGLWKDSSRSE